ncbi:HET-domain-containing protein [Aspergillus sclerotiicarbonarius CBS 121057]|uniref:HET-domain-containing protein n=1 Tax=Aspergillus sclerotiicarbonarius (strain CBS 121057 / IBT 28362) TaxID=1448318 RepID=A0A319EWD1_ASPSB|nr:HET-domain-containing protein [Aspergillus sclerotiicarbonarius CBS 121057]
MLCQICKTGLEGIWDPNKTKRLKLDDNADKDGPGQDEQLEPEKYLFAHHPTRESFLESIHQGCVMCCRFAPLYEPGRVDPLLQDVEYFSAFKVYLKPRRVIMSVYYDNVTGGFDLIPHEGPDNDLNFELGPSTADETTWTMINQWINRCVQTHTVCNNQPTGRFIPSRLLELETTGNEKMFRVVEKLQVDSRERYITLSHCWGTGPSNPALILLKNTFQNLTEYQPLSVLPKTFRDAFTVIERLGIRYLWIDRLCIFQDSPQDWQRESASMGEVYLNAWLGISALGSSNDDGGCFFSRDPAAVAPTIVNISVDSPSNPKPYRFSLEKGWAWRLTFDPEPLPKRGWTLQERLLTPRVLHFGRKQVFWECRECSCCEIHPSSVYAYEHDDYYLDDEDEGESDNEPSLAPVVKHHHIWKQLLDAPDRLHTDDPIDQVFVDWQAIVELYSGCQLTVPTDKLVAISGLTKGVQKYLADLGSEPDTYLAGLWRRELPRALGWNVLGPGRRPPSYRAPSWSWASVDCRVNLPSPYSRGPQNIITYVVVVDAECTVSTEDATGQVSGGTVTLKGPLATVTLLPMPHDYLHWRTSMSIQSLTSLEVGDHTPVTKTPKENSYGKDSRVICDVMSEMCDTIYCLPIEAHHFSGDTWVLSGLAMSKTSRDTYVRVGCVSMYFENEQAAKDLFSGFPEATCVLK